MGILGAASLAKFSFKYDTEGASIQNTNLQSFLCSKLDGSAAILGTSSKAGVRLSRMGLQAADTMMTQHSLIHGYSLTRCSFVDPLLPSPLCIEHRCNEDA